MESKFYFYKRYENTVQRLEIGRIMTSLITFTLDSNQSESLIHNFVCLPTAEVWVNKLFLFTLGS